MNPEEVIERLKTIFAFGISNCIADKIARDTTFAALEKQVPKKPNVKELPDAFGRLYWNVCGACDEEIESDYDYCPDCGQRIDWSE